MHKCWPLLAIAFLLAISSAAAVGIAPATMSATIQPAVQQSFTFYAYNDGSSEIEVEVSAEGDFAQYFTFPEGQFKVSPGELRPFAAVFTPAQNLPAGKFAARIGVSEVTQSVASGFAAKVVAQSLLSMDNPSGSILLKVSISAANVSAEGQPAVFYVFIENPTQGIVGLAQGRLSVIDSKGKEVYNSELTIPRSIPPKSSAQVRNIWSGTIRGVYTAQAVVSYGDETSTASKLIQVDKPLVEIINISVSQQENLAVILTTLKGSWPEKFSVYAEARAYFQNTPIGTSQSGVAQIESNAPVTLKTVMDIKNQKVSDLDFDVFVIYMNNVIQQRVSAEGYFPEEYQGPPMGSAIIANLLGIKPAYILAVLLIAAAVTLLWLYRREDSYGY